MINFHAKPPVLGTGPFQIKITGFSNYFKEVICSVIYKKSLATITKEYCIFVGVNPRHVKFTLNGIELKEGSTPRNLKMKYGDVILVERLPTIDLKIIDPLNIFKEMNCRVPQTKGLSNILKHYLIFIGQAEECVKFTFNGKEVNYHDTQKNLEMEDGVALIVEKVPSIHIKITDLLHNFEEKDYNVPQNKCLSTITAEYTKFIGETEDFVKFTFNGKEVNYRNSPESLKMANGDVINVEIFPSITLKFVSKFHNDVSLRILVEWSISKILNQYEAQIKGMRGLLAVTCNGRHLSKDKTPLDLGLKNDDIIQIYTEEDKINSKAIASDGIESLITVGLVGSFETIRSRYASSGLFSQHSIFVRNDQFLFDDDTPLSLNMTDGDIIHVYADDSTINVKISLESKIPNGLNYSLKYGDSLNTIMKKYTERMTIDLNSIRFMFGEKRIKSVHSPMQLEIPPNGVIRVCKEYETISLKLIGTDSDKVSLCVSLVKFMQNIRLQYENCVGSSQETILIYNGNFISDYDTPLSLNMKNNDAIQVYTQDDKINFKMSLQSKIPKDSNYSLKYGDSLDPVMIGFTDKMGVDRNSVRFMFGDHRIKSEQSLKEAKIPPNAVILVYEEYETFSLKLLAYKNSSTIFPIEAQYGDSFANIIKYCGRFEDDHSTMKLARWGVPGDIILGHHTPKELEMSNNDIVMFYRKPEINLKVAENLISKEQNGGTPNEYINLKVSYENSTEMNFRTRIDLTLKQLKKDIADKIGKSVSCLRFLFDGNRILDDHTPQSLEMEEDNVIEVEIIYITII